MRALTLCLFVALLALSGGPPSFAEEPAFPEKPFYACARFPTQNPTTVTADVKLLGGAQLANNATVAHEQIDSVNSDYWCIDLNTVTNFSPDCSQQSYLVRFHPDGANCAVSGGTPSLCIDQIVTSGGPQCWAFPPEATPVYPTVPVPSRGITATVISRGNPSYIKNEIKLDNLTISFTWYDVFYYDASGRVQKRLRALSPPSP